MTEDELLPKKKFKRPQARLHAIYVITNVKNGEQYVGLTILGKGKPVIWLRRRIQKHVQRATAEDHDWGLCKAIREYGSESFTFGLLEIIKGKAAAHTLELEYIREYNPILNTFR